MFTSGILVRHLWTNYFGLLTINPKDFDGDPIVSHKSTMDNISKFKYICSSVVNIDLVNIRHFCEEFIFPLKHHTQTTETGVQNSAPCLETWISEDYASTPVSICSINIAPINDEILKQVEGIKIKVNRHMASVVGDKRKPLYRQSKCRASSGTEKLLSRVLLTSDKDQLLIACSSTNIPTECNMERGKEVIILKKEGTADTAKVTR